MKIKLATAATALALGCALSASAANAAVVTDHIVFTTVGYADATGIATAPVDPVTADFDVTFDPTVTNIRLAVTFLTPLDAAFSALTPAFTSDPGGGIDLQGSASVAGQIEALTLQFTGASVFEPGVHTFNTAATGNDFGSYTFNSGEDLFVSTGGQVTV